MMGIAFEIWPRKAPSGAVWGGLVLAILAALAGCTTAKPLAPPEASGEGAVVMEEKVVEVWPAVVRIDDGRQGFVIKEEPVLDAAWQEDFEEAVAGMNRQEYHEARAILEKLVEQEPGVTAPYINLAICLEKTGRPELAEPYLKTALELVPGHPVASNVWGLLLRKTGRFAEAREMYEQALARFPEYLPLHRNLGILCDLYLADPACALEHYEIYAGARPGEEQVKMWIADLRIRSGQGDN